ncbi:MAG: hypothetical protein ACOC8E_00220 [Planctomycetota bacterium]
MSEAAPGPGMGLDKEKEQTLAEKTKSILDELKAETPDYGQIAADVVEARKTANALLAIKQEKDEPAEVDTPDVPDQAPVVVPPGCEAATVRDRWQEQLWLRVKSVYEMLTGETVSKLPKWGEAISLNWREKRDKTNRAKPTMTALREAHVFALLLAREPNVIRVRRGDVLFEDDFSEGTEKWLLYGPCITSRPKGGGLRRKNKRVRHADTMMWTKEEFEGNFLFEFTYIANKGGPKPGNLFAICGRPVKEEDDLSVSVGQTMATYNNGVHAYHFSMHRGNTNICNGRKVGNGLRLIGSRTPDPCPDEHAPYRIQIGKWDDLVFCIADGKLQHVYYDAGTFGPPLKGGSCGMRNWGGADATLQDVKVYRLVEKKTAKE